MARKKSSASRAHDNNLELQKKIPRDLSPDHKIDNLKTLNQLLLKETTEKRSLIDQLKAQIEDMTEVQPFASDLELEVSRIVLASAVADEAEKVKTLQEKLGSLGKERDEMRRELRSLVSEMDLGKRESLGLEAKVRDLEGDNEEIREQLRVVVAERDELERLGRKKEEGFDTLKEMMEDLEIEKEEMSMKLEEEIEQLRAEIISNAAKISALEEEGHGLSDVKLRLEGELRASKDETGFLKKEEEGLRSKVIELEQRNDEAQGEVSKLRADILQLEKQKDEMEGDLGAKIRELELEVVESGRKMEEVWREKDEIEKAKAEQEVEISELKEKAEKLNLNVLNLEVMCRDYGVKNAQLLVEKNAAKNEVVLLEKKIGEEEEEFKSKAAELSKQLSDLNVKMREVSLERDEIENAGAKKDVEIIQLRKEVEKLSSNVSELRDKCSGYSERDTQLQDERDAVERELGVQREESSRLRLLVEELKKSQDDCLKELRELKASLDALVSENDEGKRRIESLTEEKASLEKRLQAAKAECESSMNKTRAAEMVSAKVLSLLKSSAEALREAEKTQENGAIDDAEIQPFARELDGIKCAFKSRVAKIEEMKQEVGNLQGAVAIAQKKQPAALWLYSAATTLLAAISFAYAARGR